MLDKIKAWLIFGRAHTIILEAPLAIIGAGLGLGKILSLEVGLWAVFGALYHLVGYGMNSYVDWKKGFDVDDEYKQHHPLNTGDITKGQAKIAVYSGVVVLWLYSFIIGGANLYSGVMSTLLFGLGASYNYFGKITDHKYVPIALSHTLVFVYPYFVYSSGYDSIVLLITAAIFLHNVFQILISGDIKDLEQDESSLIKKWGCDVTTDRSGNKILVSSDKAFTIAVSLSLAQIAMLTPVYLIGAESTYTLATIMSLFTLGALILGVYSIRVIQLGIYTRSARVRYMSIREIVGYLLIIFSTYPAIELKGLLVLFGVMVLYLIVTSKFMWGNLITPDV